MTKKQRQKYERKQERLLAGQTKVIPLHEQTVDLESKDALKSLEERAAITKSGRFARRTKIREDNFLRGM